MTEPTTRPESVSASTLRARVQAAVSRAWDRAVESGALPSWPDDTPRPRVEVERPADPIHGDFASNLAMRLARPYRMAPLAIASALAAALVTEAADDPDASPVGSADVAPPGFLNIRLDDGALESTIAAILADPSAWGRVPVTGTRSVNVEFVSANPTGPLHVGNARGAFIGDMLSRVLEAGGQHVTREYYFNDSGGQIRNLGASVAAIRRGEPVPEDGYKADYVNDLATALPADVWDAATSGGADTDGSIGHWAAGRVREGIESSLAALGVRFDVWTSEARLHDEGWVQRAVERLRERGHVYEQDGAVWFRSTDFGDDKDRVIFRSNGEPTYFAADIGYVTEKFSRGFDHLIYIWGADHHGTVARVRNAAEAMGYDREAVQILLYSWVRFVRDGQEVSMSKRAGEFITLDELLAEVGVDAARWFFASRGVTTEIDFDIELAKKQSNENPVYYVQYAHARIASILRKAADAGLAPASDVAGTLSAGPEAALARAIVRFPEVIEDAVAAEETQGITAYATELATTFHGFYRDARVVDADEPARSAARLALADAARITLANALTLLGISAPESM
ncbi:MAG TPA: arginine--tRNA ligase [Candidatus Limnocylindrales bacterium]|nr:arginine--tRNA ligase [Candidatus Limnocylindrales bacterium]